MLKQLAVVALLSATANGGTLNFRVTGADFLDANGNPVKDGDVLFQLVNLGENGVFDPIAAGNWTSGDDVLINLPYGTNANYPSAAGMDLSEGVAFEDGTFQRLFTIAETYQVAEPGDVIGLRWFPDVSVEDYYAVIRPVAGMPYGQITISAASDIPQDSQAWTLPSADTLAVQMAPALSTGFAERNPPLKPTTNFSGLPENQIIGNDIWPEANTVANDTRYNEQNALQSLEPEYFWSSSSGNSEVVVAIIDSGIQSSHGDLSSNLWINPLEIIGNGLDDDNNGYVDDRIGWDFYESDSDPQDQNGHGTHIAGIIGAAGNNGAGISGVSWQVKLLILKVGNGSFDESKIAEAVNYACGLKERGVPIVAINNSYRFLSGASPEDNSQLRSAVARASAAGMIFVTSAGNDNRNNDLNGAAGQPSYNYPNDWAFPNLISVAGVSSANTLWSNSTFGQETITLAAPAEGVLSTSNNSGYGRLSGTSQAAAFVSGAIALAASLDPTASAERLLAALERSLDKTSYWSDRVSWGGKLSLRRLLYAMQYDLWMKTNFGSNFLSEPMAELNSDPDEDDKTNLYEFITGSDPRVPDGFSSSLSLAYIDGLFQFDYYLNPNSRLYEIEMETTTDLNSPLSWNLDKAGLIKYQGIRVDTANREMAHFRLLLSPENVGKVIFGRLKISNP